MEEAAWVFLDTLEFEYGRIAEGGGDEKAGSPFVDETLGVVERHRKALNSVDNGNRAGLSALTFRPSPGEDACRLPGGGPGRFFSGVMGMGTAAAGLGGG